MAMKTFSARDTLIKRVYILQKANETNDKRIELKALDKDGKIPSIEYRDLKLIEQSDDLESVKIYCNELYQRYLIQEDVLDKGGNYGS